MESDPVSKTTSYAIIRDGKIVAGGNPCARCGKPTMSSWRKDPFLKSDAFEWLCDEHMPFRTEVKAQ